MIAIPDPTFFYGRPRCFSFAFNNVITQTLLEKSSNPEADYATNHSTRCATNQEAYRPC